MMNNLKISTRLMALLGLLSVLLLAVGGVGLYGIAKADDALDTVYNDRLVPSQQLAEVSQFLLRGRFEIVASLAFPEQTDKYTAAAETYVAEAGKLWSAYMANNHTAEEARLAKIFGDAQGRFVAEGLQPAVAALRAKDAEGAKRIVLEKLAPLYKEAREAGTKLIQLERDIAKAEYDAASARTHTIRAVSIGSIALGVLCALGFGWSMQRGIARGLAQAVDVANAVAQGDLSRPIRAEGKDEIAALLAALAAMRASLIRVVTSVRQGAEGVATASSQIAQGNQDLSARTESQASALEQTASSMEELGSTVHQNADNARQANQLAMSASTVAVQGGEVVGQVVETMKGINESSRKIADIIQVIDGIAFQTNILALNAAVEAARAGEQGRGFAVVAGEVRSLAQRSAQAAKEIKDLIQASVERVDQGTHLVDQAGATMTEVVSSIRRVTDIMGEISAASTEQANGVAQVGQAVQQLDQTTQQNAALVEEMAAAASSLHTQAEDLVRAMAQFKLDGTDAPAARPASAPRPASRAPKAVLSAPKAAPAKPALAKTGGASNPRPALAKAAPAGGGHGATAKPSSGTSQTALAPQAKGADDDWETF